MKTARARYAAGEEAKLDLNQGFEGPPVVESFDPQRAAKELRRRDLRALAALLLKQLQSAEADVEIEHVTAPPTHQEVEPYRTCPHCSHHGPVQRDFGWQHRQDGKIYPCSWCRKCRRYPDLKKALAGSS